VSRGHGGLAAGGGAVGVPPQPRAVRGRRAVGRAEGGRQPETDAKKVGGGETSPTQKRR
jgi:hypothetical protein